MADEKSSEMNEFEMLFGKGTPVDVGHQTIMVQPLKMRQVKNMTDAIMKIVQKIFGPGGPWFAENPDEALASIGPDLLNIAFDEVVEIVAAGIDKSEDWVLDNLTANAVSKLLEVIVEVNDFEGTLKNFQTVWANLPIPQALREAPAQTEATAEEAAAELTEEESELMETETAEETETETTPTP